MWNDFIELTEDLDNICYAHCGEPEERGPWHPNHINKFYRSVTCELAHTSVVDLREEKGLWMMHTAFFASPAHPMPVYGFDVICGEKKVTGCFHDLSPTVYLDNGLDRVWKTMTNGFEPARKRELPEWANFFSDNMIVMGATSDPTEIKRACHIGLRMAHEWWLELGRSSPVDAPEVLSLHEQGKMDYCEGQLKNERSKDVMTNVLGMDRKYVERFKRIQFPF